MSVTKVGRKESYVEHLKAKQKLKVEELKKRTAYYTTRNLLERYDPALKTKDEEVASRTGRAMTTGILPSSSSITQRFINSVEQDGWKLIQKTC